MSVAAHRRAKAEIPVPRLAACLVLVKAAISPGGSRPACRTPTREAWCCWPMSGRPLPCRTALWQSPMDAGNYEIKLRRSPPDRPADETTTASGLAKAAVQKRTTDSHHAWPVAPNLLDQDFAATGPDKKWGADISYVWTRKAGCIWPLSSTCSHAASSAGATGDRLHRDLALAALRKALTMRRPAAGLIHHSDRGQSVLLDSTIRRTAQARASYSDVGQIATIRTRRWWRR